MKKIALILFAVAFSATTAFAASQQGSANRPAAGGENAGRGAGTGTHSGGATHPGGAQHVSPPTGRQQVHQPQPRGQDSTQEHNISTHQSDASAPSRVEHPRIQNSQRSDLQKSFSVSPERSQQHKRTFVEERSKFQKAPPMVRSVIKEHVPIDPKTYHERRHEFYNHFNYEMRPSAFRTYPHFGRWDSKFLFFALNRRYEMPYGVFFFDHWNEPEIIQWREETLGLEDDELRNEVEDLQRRLDEYQNQGMQADPDYVPEDAQDIAYSEEAVEAQEPEQVAAQPLQAPQWKPPEQSVASQPAPQPTVAAPTNEEPKAAEKQTSKDISVGGEVLAYGALLLMIMAVVTLIVLVARAIGRRKK